jgi:fucose permease
MSLYTVAFIGTAPVGSLMSGAIANRIGAPITIAVGGSICIMAAIVFAVKLPIFRRHLRPIYTRLGILELEVASSLKSVDEPSVPEVQ